MSFTHILPATTTFPKGQDNEALPEGGKLLSSTEALRLTRAMYRHQLMCNLFGFGPYSAYRHVNCHGLAAHHDIYQAFV